MSVIAVARTQLRKQSTIQRVDLGTRPSTRDLGRLCIRLIAPLRLKAGERLIFVPHGALHYLPFQALSDETAYLIERHAIASRPRRALACSWRSAAAKRAAGSSPSAIPRSRRSTHCRPPSAKCGASADLFPDVGVPEPGGARSGVSRETPATRACCTSPPMPKSTPSIRCTRASCWRRRRATPGFLEAREVYGSTCRTWRSSRCRPARAVWAASRAATRSLVSRARSSSAGATGPDRFALAGRRRLHRSPDDDVLRGTRAWSGGIQAIQAAPVAVLKRPRFGHPFFWAPFNLIGDWRMRASV